MTPERELRQALEWAMGAIVAEYGDDGPRLEQEEFLKAKAALTAAPAPTPAPSTNPGTIIADDILRRIAKRYENCSVNIYPEMPCLTPVEAVLRCAKEEGFMLTNIVPPAEPVVPEREPLTREQVIDACNESVRSGDWATQECTNYAELTRQLNKRLAAAPRAAGGEREIENILHEVCQILRVELGPGLARYVPLIARARALAAAKPQVEEEGK